MSERDQAASPACPTCAMTVAPDNDGDLFCPCCGWDPMRDAGPIPCEAHPAQAILVARLRQVIEQEAPVWVEPRVGLVVGVPDAAAVIARYLQAGRSPEAGEQRG